MPFPWAAAIAGGTSLLGGTMQGQQQERMMRMMMATQMQRQNQIDAATAPYVNSRGPNGQWTQGMDSPWETQLNQFFQNMQNTPAQQFNFNPLVNQNIDPSLVDTTRFDPRAGGGTQLAEWYGNPEMLDQTMGDRYLQFERLTNPNSFGGMINSSQDALMQLLSGSGGTARAGNAAGVGIGNLDMDSWGVKVDPITGQVSNAARSNMESMVADGANFDTTPLMQAIRNQSQTAINRQAAELQGSAGSIGQRFGTVLNAQEGRMRSEMQEAANLREQQAAQSSWESAQGRRLAAAQNLTAQDQILNNVAMHNQSNMIQQGGMNLDAVVAGRGQDASVASANAQVNIANANNQTAVSQQNQMQRLQAAQALAQLQLGAQGNMIQGAGNYNNTIASMLQAAMGSQRDIALGNQGTQTNYDLARNTFAQNNSRIQQGDNQLLAQILGQNAGIINNTNQFNEANRLNVGQFNNQFGLDAWQANQGATQQQQQMLMQLLGMGLNQNNMRDNRALQALGIRAGMPQVQTNPQAAGGGWGALGDAGNAFLMWQMMNGGGGGGASRAPISSAGGSYPLPNPIGGPSINTGLGYGQQSYMPGLLAPSGASMPVLSMPGQGTMNFLSNGTGQQITPEQMQMLAQMQGNAGPQMGYAY